MKNKQAEILNEEVSQFDVRADNETVIPVIQEEVLFEKRVVESGKVRITKSAREYEEIVDEPLFREEVTVERVPLNQVVESRLPVRYEGDLMIIPVVEEQVFVQKRLVLTEELRVRKQTIETHKPQRVTLLKEEVEIQRVAGNKNSDG